MIITKNVKIKLCNNSKNYWKEKGYQIDFDIPKEGIDFTVDVNHLKSNSNVNVECLCDECETTYVQRYSRNTDICGKCSSHKKLLGNTYGKNNAKYDIPLKEILINDIENLCLSSVAKKYNVSLPVVKRWLKYYDIKLIPYYGRKYFKTHEEENEFVNMLKKLIDIKLNDIHKETKVPKTIIKHLCNKHNLKYSTQFDDWEKQRNKIKENFDFFKNENKLKDLKTIASENYISYDALKDIFKENNEKVILHSYNKSNGELELKQFIHSLGIDCKSIKFHKKYEIDCFVESHNIGFEYCGEYWHSDLNKDKNYHQQKTLYFKELNISLFTIFETEWINKQNIIKSIIKAKLGVIQNKIYARKCTVKEISNFEAKKFHESNHISGYVNSSFNIGLYDNEKLVSVMSFSKSRFDKKYQFELTRFSNILDYIVIGGFSKLLSFFRKNYSSESLLSYADLRFSDGKTYHKFFEYVGITPPNYFYFKNGLLESRIKYQKHKLIKMQSYDDEKTERTIMYEEGYYRIYDCGNLKFTLI